jgi:hypothetical protein
MLYDPDFDVLRKRIDAPRRPSPPPLGKWAWVFIVNLPVALFFGTLVTTAIGAAGMWLGVAVLFLIGRRACFVARESVLTVVYGGWILAAFQFIPVGQIAAGIMGVGAVQGMGLANPEMGPIHTALGGFLATIITGSLLLLAAAALGLVVRGWFYLMRLVKQGAAI